MRGRPFREQPRPTKSVGLTRNTWKELLVGQHSSGPEEAIKGTGRDDIAEAESARAAAKVSEAREKAEQT
jgi:hypothetical protein